MKQETTGAAIAFQWSYVILPLVFLVLSIILTAVFYSQLPGEVAYRFESDGSPDKFVSRAAIVLWMLLPQLVLTLMGVAATLGITKMSARFRQSESPWIDPKKIVFAMGNMVALPQIILFLAMLDIYSYNSHQVHLLPLWASALVVMLLGGGVMGYFFLQIFLRAWKTSH